MNKILVTGGTGYIGSHTVVELMEAGYEVIIIDSLASSDKSVLEGIEKIIGEKPQFKKIDLCDIKKCRTFFEDNLDIDAIIHFAAYKSVIESITNPLKYYQNNLNSLMNLLVVMKEKNLNNLVFSSSATVYGDANELPVTEKSPLKKATCAYGETKQICEDIISSFVKSDLGFSTIALRYFNPIGAHFSIEIGESPIGIPANLVPFVTQTGIGLRKELQVFGGNYDTPDGTCIRDYIHVVDLARAHVCAVKRLISKNKKGVEIFNLGTGEGNSVLDVIHSFERVSGKKLSFRITERRDGDIETSFADTRLANKTLNWKTKSSLDDAMKTAWQWEQKIAKGKNL